MGLLESHPWRKRLMVLVVGWEELWGRRPTRGRVTLNGFKYYIHSDKTSNTIILIYLCIMRHFKFNNLLWIQTFLCVKRKIWLKLAVSLSEHCEELWIRKFRGGACCQPDELLKANPFSSAVISFWKRPFAVVALIAGICLLDLYDTARHKPTFLM